ncbi:MAG: cbb3-type cytochrome c oxidase subunit I [Gemmatimonadaceae bacterium]|nr:cbb3-type cytochrome c oxidase subunit I [Gemmatimonadaceae bacterium]
MHSLARRYLKTAIFFLVVGLVLGVWLLVRRELGGAAISARELSAHTHALLVGFVMMMIAGVALWLFPRPSADDTRYRPWLAELAWWCIAPGTALRIGAEVMAGFEPPPALRVAIVAGGLLQATGLALVFWTLFPRIRAAGSAQREAKGERF